MYKKFFFVVCCFFSAVGMDRPVNRYQAFGLYLDKVRSAAEKKFEVPSAVKESDQYKRLNFLIKKLKTGRSLNIAHELEKIKVYETWTENRLKPHVSTFNGRNCTAQTRVKKIFPFYPIARAYYNQQFLPQFPYRDYVYLADAQAVANDGYSSLHSLLAPMMNTALSSIDKGEGNHQWLAISPILIDAFRRAGAILITDKKLKGNSDDTELTQLLNTIYHSITDSNIDSKFETTHQLLEKLPPTYRYLVKAFIAQSIADFQTAEYCLKMIVKLAPQRRVLNHPGAYLMARVQEELLTTEETVTELQEDDSATCNHFCSTQLIFINILKCGQYDLFQDYQNLEAKDWEKKEKQWHKLVRLFEKQKYERITPSCGKKPRERLMKACMYLDIDAYKSASSELSSILETKTISPLLKARIQEEHLYQKLLNDSIESDSTTDPL